MKRNIRTAALGMIAGAIAGIVLLLDPAHPRSSILFGILVGAAFAIGVKRVPLAGVDSVMAGGSLGIPLWGLISVVTLPLLSGQKPEWGAEQMRAQLPSLVAWVLFGVLLGLLIRPLNRLAERILGPEKLKHSAPQEDKRNIVILGGGFAGMKTAE